jgi:methylmalonyl-CoA mutase, N-terminal domain
VIAFESNVTQTVDPLAGSYFVEALTSELEARAWKYLEDIDARGGTVAAIEAGYIQNEILNSAYADQRRIDEGSLKVVGVNCFQEDGKEAPIEILRMPPELERQAVERVRAYRARRNQDAARDALRALREGAQGDANLQGLILQAAHAGATLGEISDAMREVFGLYQEYSGF